MSARGASGCAAPRYIYAHGEMPIKVIDLAPVVNHSDAKLIMLAALVDRKPPFAGSGVEYKYYQEPVAK